ncbi:MAG: DUF1800 domain-containing protein [Verrucomicrobiae bacterium]|nr:DUF1800 domain-containing protein [Verrucomicrobiae bacterium]
MLKPAEEAQWTKRSAAHLLNRAGFGGCPDQIEHLYTMGRHKAVGSLLNDANDREKFPDPEWTAPEAVEEMRREFMEIRRINNDQSMSPAEREMARREAQRNQRLQQRRMTQESIELWLSRMLSSQAQTREKMTLFWHGHFATSIQKVKSPLLIHQQNALFRSQALGNFKSLTHAICEDPAMMLYLDTDKNVKGRPNENFARELLELFTLGEGSGYTETDIAEAARAFTGYQLNRIVGRPTFVPRKHDRGEKTFMGKSGPFKQDDIVDIVFETPRCAEFMVAKLWEFFVYEEPADEIVKTLAKQFRDSGYEVKPLLQTIFLSNEFNSAKAMRTQIKSPVQFIVQMARELELPKVPPRIAENAMQQLGQVLYNPPNVAGWEGGRSWINTNTLLSRYNIAGFLLKGDKDGGGKAKNRDKGKGNKMRERLKDRVVARMRKSLIPFDRLAPLELRDDRAALIAALTERFFHADLPDKDLAKFRDYAKSKESKRFTDEEVGELIHLMMSTPQYQLV